MGKTPVSWLDVVKKTSKNVAKGTGLKGILPKAKKEWMLIKSGKHPTMMVAVGAASKRNTGKKRKTSKRKTSKRKSKKRRK